MGPPKSPQITQTSQVKLGPEQQQVFDQAFPSINAYAQQTPKLFPGTGIAGFNPWELFGQGQVTGTAAPQAQALATSGANAQQQLLDPNFMLNPNQYVMGAADAMTRKVTDNLFQTILPRIRSASTLASGPYAHNTKEGIATGQAIGQTNQGLSDALANMLLANYTQGLGGMSQAIAHNPSVIQSQIMPASMYASVGGQERAMEQAQLDERIRQFYAQQDLPLSRAQQLLQLMQGIPGGQGVSTVTGAMAQTNPIMQALGFGLQGLGLMGGMPGLGFGGMGLGMGK